MLAGTSHVAAFDGSTMIETPAIEGQTQADVVNDAFRFGARAYKDGDKSTAFDALTYAADNGHMASQWKLGRMYAAGDGVEQDDGRAFDIFNNIVERFGDARPGSVEARYVSNAFVKLSEFLIVGIKEKVSPDRGRAREYLFYAASYFRDPDAQYNLAMFYLAKEGRRTDYRQAARWLNKAARRGHIQSQLVLGDLLLSGEKIPRQPVNGLKWLTVARMLDSGNLKVQDHHEAAFAQADPDHRRRAVSLAEEWLEGSLR